MERLRIPIAGCRDRQLYRIHSRNLDFGVFDAKSGGFFGIREKFGSLYVFVEYHHDNGPYYGTVSPKEELSEALPDSIQLTESLGSCCGTCRQAVEFVKNKEPPPPEEPWKVGKWVHLVAGDCTKHDPVNKSNDALFEWLMGMERKYKEPGDNANG